MSTKVKYSELSQSRKEAVLNDHLQDETWHDQILETLKEELAEAGFENADIMYTGFWSQGDGASFTCNLVDVNAFFFHHWKLMDFEFSGVEHEEVEEILDTFGISRLFLIKELISKGLIGASIHRTTNHYCHENTIEVNVEFETYYDNAKNSDEVNLDVYELTKEQYREVQKFEPVFVTYISLWVKHKCREIYSRLEKEYDKFVKDTKDYLENEDDFLYTP